MSERPPVEPLSDVAWARVERGLWSRLDAAPEPERQPPSPRRWIWVAAPLVAAMAIVFLVTRDRGEPVTTPPETADVRVVAPATAATTATFDDAHIELAPASAVLMRRDRPATILERGAAWFSVAPRVDRPPFTVLAGDTTVRVLGTRFRVARHDDRVTVEVDHGRVEVQLRDRVQILGANQHWSSEAPERVETDLPPPPPPPPPPVKPTIPDPVPVVPKPADPKPRVDDQARFEQLSVLEKKDPQAAITGYLEIAQRGSKWAPIALFAAARLAADRKDPRAEQLLTSYLKRFPKHANADDALELLARIKR